MYLNIDDIKLYYKVYGSGAPIILLHGNGEDHKIFLKLIDLLKINFKVYAIDSRCHGKSDCSDDISYNIMANDIIYFISTLNIEKPILYGFSDGGIIGLKIAIKDPTLLSKLIISGANLNPKGMKFASRLFYNFLYLFNRNKLSKMMLKTPNIKEYELNKITIPVIVIAGENDVIKLKHTKFIANNINDSTLHIVAKENHSSYIVNSNKIYFIIKKFL